MSDRGPGGLTADGNWLLAIRTTLPDAVEELRAQVARLDAEKQELLALVHDYEDLIQIACRRHPVPIAGALDLLEQGRV